MNKYELHIPLPMKEYGNLFEREVTFNNEKGNAIWISYPLGKEHTGFTLKLSQINNDFKRGFALGLLKGLTLDKAELINA